MMPVTVKIRRGMARFTSRSPGRLSRHSLSFGEHLDPTRLRLGPMVAHDEHVIGGGRGFESHRHRDLEIVTWVLAGRLDHRDSLGTDRRLGPGSVAVLCAGSGVEHAETAAPGEACRFVQAWLLSDEPGRAPGYAAARVEPSALSAGLVPVASAGAPGARLRLGTAGATLAVTRLAAGERLELAPTPTAPGAQRQVYVAAGALLRSSLAEPLAAGDSLEITDADRLPLLAVQAAVDSELMVWTFC